MHGMMRPGGVCLALVLLLAAAAPAGAQDQEEIGVWKKEVKLALNILQSSYSNNWNGGDKGSVTWTGNVDAFLEKSFSERTNWRNTLKLAYGQSHQQERASDGSLYWPRPDKTDDLIDFESLFRMTPRSGWDPFAAFNFESKFEDLSDPSGRSLSLNPMTFKESAGVSRVLVKSDERELMLRLGMAYIQNSRKFYPDPLPDQTLQRENSTEVAGEMVANYKAKVLDGRVGWESKLVLTLPFSWSGKSIFEDGGFTTDSPLPEDVASYTTALDADWENTFTANITKVISVKLYMRWVYDKYDNTVKPVVEDGALVNEADVHQAIRKAGQFKQTLALGFGYTFN
jgi:hypothetical protein